MNRLLTEALPLRTTRDLGNYSVDAVLPLRIGDLTTARFNLIRLTDTDWLAADHAMQITSAFIDAVSTDAWDYLTRSDGKGHTWTVVRFGSPVPQGSQASACGRGIPLSNPAEIMEYLFRFHGLDNTFPDLRAECAAAGFRISGSIESAVALATAIDVIAGSVGAIWTPTSGRLYPVSAVVGYVEQLSEYQADGVQVGATIVDTADILLLSYDVSDATGRPQQSIQFTASPQRYGGLVQEITLPWLRSAANAAAVGVPWCQRIAGERYSISYSSPETDIRPCQWTRLIDNPELALGPLKDTDPDVMVLAVTVAPDSDSALIEGEVVLSRPRVSITAHSLALPDTTSGGIDLSISGGIGTFTITDQNGNAIANARVSLNDSPPRTTDSQGNVEFPVQPGTTYTLNVEAAGMTPFSIQVQT